jgi:zinc transporter ZupT
VLLTLDPNLVPWMTILGVLGAAVGYLIGGAVYPAAMVPALYGLCIGSIAGILVRIVLRSRTKGKKDSEDSSG